MGLVLMGRAMLSKSLIWFSIDGWSCAPSLLFTGGQTKVEVKKMMATSFKRSHACTATLSAAKPTAGHHQPTPPLETPGHSQASLGQSPVGSLLLCPGPWCTQVLLVPPRVCFPSPMEVQALRWGLWPLLQRAHATRGFAAPRAPAPAAAHRWPGTLQEALKHSRYCIVIDYSPYNLHFILLTPLFFSWNFVHLNLPHLFAFLNPLSSDHHLCILWIYNSISVSFFLCLFIFDSTYKWNHLVFDFLCMIYFT